MTNFFQQFRTFALDAWTEDGGLVLRPQRRPVQSARAGGSQRRGAARQWSTIGLMAAVALAASTALVPLPATASATAWEQVRATPKIVSDRDVVPANHWAGVVAHLRASPKVKEADYIDVDSVF